MVKRLRQGGYESSSKLVENSLQIMDLRMSEIFYLMTAGKGESRPSGFRGRVPRVGGQERGAVRIQEGEGAAGQPQVGGVQAAPQR